MVRLIDLNPNNYSPIPLADGIICGVSFKCPKGGKAIHSVYFWPPINPYGVPIDFIITEFEKRGIKPHTRISGDGWDNLTLIPSIGNMRRDKSECCHIHIRNGNIE